MRLLLVVVAVVAVGCTHVDGGGSTSPGEPRKLPVTTPGEVGRLSVLETYQTPASSTVVLGYSNDTGRSLRAVRLECVLLDGRGAVVNVGAVELDAVAPGGEASRRLRIVDSSERAERAECSIASAR